MSGDAGRPALSVVIPCRDATATLPAQLASLAAQIDPPPFEVVLVDNRSRDGLADWARPWTGELPGLRVVAAPERPGAAHARNVGIRAARAERILFLDADDLCCPHVLADAERCFGTADLWSGSAIPVADAGFEEAAPGALAAHDDATFHPPRVEDDGPLPVLMGAVFGATRTLLRELDGFDEALATAGEDNELAARARSHGVRVPVAASVRIAYRYRTDPAARRREIREGARAQVLVATRYGQWSRSPLRRPVRDLARCGAAGLLMVLVPSRRDAAALSERVASALGALDGVLRHRLLGRGAPRRGAGLAGLSDGGAS